MKAVQLQRVLLLEDTAADAELIVDQLQQHFGDGVRVDVAANDGEATKLAAASRYDLYLVDYYLGTAVTGTDWVRSCHQNYDGTMPPVIVLTGMDDVAQIEAEAAETPGVCYFLSKDFHDASNLRRSIHFALKNRDQMTQPRPNSVTIVMADDDHDDQLLVADAFEEVRLENRLDFVGNGEELLAYLRRQGRFAHLMNEPLPGLVLLDLNMPRMDGRQALVEIRADAQLRRIPVVLLTTSEADRDLLQGYDLGANSYVVKPVGFDDLVRVVREITTYWLSIVVLPTSYYRAED
ncbi:MAG: response regulator [Mariprofundales bacterium]|nr:response regulator [Mariprofundales bacterium]